MKFQNPSLILFLNRQDTRTHARTDKPKPICSHFFKVGGINITFFHLKNYHFHSREISQNIAWVCLQMPSLSQLDIWYQITINHSNRNALFIMKTL